MWLMRQAGRYLPQYRAIRKAVDFMTLVRTPALATEVTLQPVDLIGVDAAIIFSDIWRAEAMGMTLHFDEGSGPHFRMAPCAGGRSTTWPIVPTLTCGFVRSNCALAMWWRQLN